MTVLALALRGFGVGDTPLWFDEAYSYWFATQPLQDLWGDIPTLEPHPPLYYTILKLWMVFGDSETALRSLSVFFSVSTVPVVYVLGRMIDGNRLGLLAAMLFTLSPLHIAFAGEARPYAVLTFWVSVCLCGAVWLVRHPERAAQPILKDNKARLAWLALGLGGAAALWLHNLAAMLFPALLVGAGISQVFSHGRNTGFVKNIALVSILIVLLWAPMLPWLWIQSQNVSSGFWIPELSAPQILGALVRLFGFISTDGQVLMKPSLGLMLLAAFVPMVIYAKSSTAPAHALILSVMFVPLLVLTIISLFFVPVLLFRSLIWVSVPFYIALAGGILELKRPALQIIGCIAAGGLFLLADPSEYTRHAIEPWDEITRSITQTAEPEDAVLFVPNSALIPYSYYQRNSSKVGGETIPLPASFPAPGLDTTYPSGQLGEPGLSPAMVSAALERTAKHKAVWLVMRTRIFDPTNSLVSALKARRTLRRHDTYGDIAVYQFK